MEEDEYDIEHDPVMTDLPDGHRNLIPHMFPNNGRPTEVLRTFGISTSVSIDRTRGFPSSTNATLDGGLSSSVSSSRTPSSSANATLDGGLSSSLSSTRTPSFSRTVELPLASHQCIHYRSMER